MKTKKLSLLIIGVFCLVVIDVVVSKISGSTSGAAVDSYVYESGSSDIDGYTSASITAHVSLVQSDYSGLSFSKSKTDALTPNQIREMVYKAIQLDIHFGARVSELAYKISQKESCWVAIMPNIVYEPGRKYTPGDQTDPRVIWAVLDYIADSTSAKRITLLAGGGYGTFSQPDSIFEKSSFISSSGAVSRWNTFFPGLDDTFSLKSIVRAAQARHTDKIIECINSNYNEILQGGIPYNELSTEARAGKLPEYYPVPVGDNNIGALPTANTVADNSCYNPTAAVYYSDILVNVPVMKTTDLVQTNAVFKNYIGSVSRAVYGTGTGYPINRSTSLNSLDHSALTRTCINLFSYHPSDYCIVDALASLEGEGSHPWSYRTGFLRRNLIIAGGDPVAVEAVGSATIKMNPNDNDLIRWARAKGYGYGELSKIGIRGSNLPDVQTDIMASMGITSSWTSFQNNHFYGRGCRRWLLNGPYDVADNSTSLINEASADPRSGDSVNGKPWTAYYSPSNDINLLSALPGAQTSSAAYAFTQIYSESNQSGLLYIGATRDIKVWINGEMVADTAGILVYRDINLIRNVTLRQGDNRILVKVRKNGSVFKFSLAVVNSGLESPRNSYIPHASNSPSLGTVSTLSAEQKKSYFGGRTLFGTFYHLGQSDSTAVEKDLKKGSAQLFLSQNSPNPFKGSTRFSFTVPQGYPPVDLAIYDISGQKVFTLFSGNVTPGIQNTCWWNGQTDAGKLASSGIYFYRLRAGNQTLMRRLIYTR